ncbi:MAG: hypothetical protein IT445_11410, partial [Phycisphaeraceae bacterium]|nr:hypothetical protein [Phycisphaeraceae bacterium]
MKKTLLTLATTCVAMVVMTSSASAVQYYFTNAAADNNFATLANWNTMQDGTGSVPGAFSAADDYRVDTTGTDYAELSSTLPSFLDDVSVGWTSGQTGELRITGGNNTFDNTLRLGRVGGDALLVFSGGTINVPDSYTTIGDSGNVTTVNMTGGTWNSSRQTWGQQTVDIVTLNMSGGVINLATTDPTPANTDGGLRMGLGTIALNFTGTSVVNMQKLYIREGGVMTIDGGTLNVTGTVDANPTFNFLEADIGGGDPGLDLFGKIDYKSGNLNITGDYESLFDTAISFDKVYTSNHGYKV